MRDESHLDDMRSAIRGDFERLAERRGGQELMRPEPEPEPEPKLEVEVLPESLAEPVQKPPEPPPVEPPHKGFLDRLLGR